MIQGSGLKLLKHETGFEPGAYPRRDPHVGKEMLALISMRIFA